MHMCSLYAILLICLIWDLEPESSKVSFGAHHTIRIIIMDIYSVSSTTQSRDGVRTCARIVITDINPVFSAAQPRDGVRACACQFSVKKHSMSTHSI